MAEFVDNDHRVRHSRQDRPQMRFTTFVVLWLHRRPDNIYSECPEGDPCHSVADPRERMLATRNGNCAPSGIETLTCELRLRGVRSSRNVVSSPPPCLHRKFQPSSSASTVPNESGSDAQKRRTVARVGSRPIATRSMRPHSSIGTLSRNARPAEPRGNFEVGASSSRTIFQVMHDM